MNPSTRMHANALRLFLESHNAPSDIISSLHAVVADLEHNIEEKLTAQAKARDLEGQLALCQHQQNHIG